MFVGFTVFLKSCLFKGVKRGRRTLVFFLSFLKASKKVEELLFFWSNSKAEISLEKSCLVHSYIKANRACFL